MTRPRAQAGECEKSCAESWLYWASGTAGACWFCRRRCRRRRGRLRRGCRRCDRRGAVGERGVDLGRLARGAGIGRQHDRQDDEQAAEDRRRAGQEIRRAARGHEARRAAADAEAAAFRALHQDDADQRGGDERLDDQQEGEHRRAFVGMAVRGDLGDRGASASTARRPRRSAGNRAAFRLAPPTSAPSTSATAKISAAFEALTEPP